MGTTDASHQERPPLTPVPQYTVHDKQLEVLQSDARYRTLKWGRRGGKNIVAVIDIEERGRAPWESQWGSDDPANTVVWWVGPSYDQAYRYGFETLKAALPNSWIDSSSESEPYEIRLINGVRYEFRTFDHPKTLQGAGVDHVVIDEADYMPDNLWYNDLDPMLMDSRGSAMFISKPIRPRSYFADHFERGQSSDYPEYFSSHATSADNPYIAEDPTDKKGAVPNHVYQQEYLAELPDDGGQVFKKLGDRLFTASYPLEGDVIEGIGEAKRDPSDCAPPFSVGVDFARHQDYRVTIALDAAGELSYFSRNQNEGWDTIEDDIKAVHTEYPGIVLPDASRDNKIVSDLASAGVNVNPVDFSPKTKKSLIDDLITRVENGELTAPSVPELDQLRLELRMLERNVTETGYTRYHAPETGHDDCVDSFALAASALDHLKTTRRRREQRDEKDDPENRSRDGIAGL
ncbi:hypothetical protein [Natrononativus amylolyticus]|uniref:hypothetical protein n=1 Tax=Natrononativus amylolyticus TaxID=2963434 RepID=UPI0020CEBD46|nr:hypothetical protein [Natrononativus amylolyticus]